MLQTRGDLRPNLIAANVVTTAFALIALALRCFSRIQSKRSSLWWDDWLAIASAPFIITFVGLNSWFVSKGLGLHVPEAEKLGSPSDWKLILYIENLIYNTGLSLIKLSVVVFYLRVFKDIKLYRYAIWFGIFLALAWCVGNNFLAAFECSPARAYWHPEIPHTCIQNEKGFLGTTISNVVVDFYILLLPVPILWRLQLSARRKIAIIGIFICGYCVAIVSLVRLVSIIRLGSDVTDFTWSFVLPQMMVAIEPSIALFASCLPAIFQLSKRYIEKWRLGTAQSSKPLSRNSVVHMGALGNPVGVRGYKQFTQVDSERDSDSIDKLYQIPGLTGDEDTGSDAYKHRIYVTNDVRIDTEQRC